MELTTLATIRRCVIMPIIIVFAAFAAFPFDFECDGIQYSIIDRQARTCCTENATSVPGELVIPSVVSDGDTQYTVTEIGRRSFRGTPIVSVTIPETVTKIGTLAFSQCRSLKAASLPESLVEIGDSAFYLCNYDGKWGASNTDCPFHVRIPDGVRRIGKAAFMLDNYYTGIYLTPANIPSSLTEIGDFCFYWNAPEDLEWPKVSSLSKIGKYAFYRAKIKEVAIPSDVTSIGEYAFYQSHLEHAALPAKLREMGSGVFMDCEQLTFVDIPEGISAIGDAAFEYTQLQSVSLPSTITHIGDRAFRMNTSRPPAMFDVNLPDGITYIGEYAFAGCNLTSVRIPQSIDSIRNGTFSGVKSMVSVDLPESVTYIGSSAFYNCKLRELSLPVRLKHIGNNAFAGCDFTSVYIPENVRNIGYYAFKDCSRLQHVTIPDNLSVIESGMFEGCTSLSSLSSTSSPQKTDLGDIMIPKGIETIEYDAFTGCSSIRSVTIPATVKRLKSNPFPDCQNLEEFIIDEGNTNYRVVDMAILTADGDTLVAFPTAKGGHFDIPPSVTTIGQRAFFRNTGLESINIPDGVLHIEREAFSMCKKYHDPVLPLTIQTIDEYAFGCIPFKNLVLPPSLRRIDHGFGNGYETSDKGPEIESVKIYGYFDYVRMPFGYWNDNIRSVYYITTWIQEDNGRYSFDDYINWGLDHRSTLYVLEEVYDEIRNGDYIPWRYFEDIRIYDPSDDPYYASLKEIDRDIDPSLPVSVFSLSGARIADSTDSLPPGIYIVRQGGMAKKIAVN